MTAASCAGSWDENAERRLLKQLTVYKPVGVLRHFQVVQLARKMNYVRDDEDTDFEDLLTPEDLAKHQEWKADVSVGKKPKPNVYEPVYKVRPTEKMIWEKLDTWYDIHSLDKYEYTPDEFTQHADFFLPDGDFSELLRDKEEQLERAGQPTVKPSSASASAPARSLSHTPNTRRHSARVPAGGSKRSLESPSPTSMSTTTSRVWDCPQIEHAHDRRPCASQRVEEELILGGSFPNNSGMMAIMSDSDDLPSMDDGAPAFAARASATDSDAPHFAQHHRMQSTAATSSLYEELDVSNRQLPALPSVYERDAPGGGYRVGGVRSLTAARNMLTAVPPSICVFCNLISLDLSHNRIASVSPDVGSLHRLRVLSLSNNLLNESSLPKSMRQLQWLEVLNLAGNRFAAVPPVVLALARLRALYFGANELKELPVMIGKMRALEVLYLGGNKLSSVPDSIGDLSNLVSLVLSDNRLSTMPPAISKLQRLHSLSLHNNRLTVLPPAIVRLRNLQQLSLRSNPLVARFVRELCFEPAPLKELAGRTIKLSEVAYKQEPPLLPDELLRYLDSASQCVNPKCAGVYFSSRVEHVKFVDFCGKYRVPLLQYLCSPQCGARRPAVALPHMSAESASHSDADSELDDGVEPQSSRMRKVLLG